MYISVEKILFKYSNLFNDYILLLVHLGCGGSGIGGNLISGIGFINKGFGGGNWDGLIPPFANGKSPIDGTCCFKFYIGIVFGWL